MEPWSPDIFVLEPWSPAFFSPEPWSPKTPLRPLGDKCFSKAPERNLWYPGYLYLILLKIKVAVLFAKGSTNFNQAPMLFYKGNIGRTMLLVFPNLSSLLFLTDSTVSFTNITGGMLT